MNSDDIEEYDQFLAEMYATADEKPKPNSKYYSKYEYHYWGEDLSQDYINYIYDLAELDIPTENIDSRYRKDVAIVRDRYGEDVKFYVYSNYANLANKTVLGKNAKQIREEHNVSKDVSVTQLITPEQQEELENVKDRIATLISMNLDYYAIKAIVTGNGVKELNAKYSKKKKTA